MTWYPARCISALQDQLDDAFPDRTRPDWVVGDPAHSSRDSDHNPDERGMVHAIDVRLGGGLDVKRVLGATIGDPRTWYVIHNRIIYSRTYDFAARRYTGANPHETHIHLSVLYTERAEKDTSAWGVDKVKVYPPIVDLSVVRRQFLLAAGLREGELVRRLSVARTQRALVDKAGADLKVDGLVGPRTLRAYAEWEARWHVPGKGREKIPDWASLAHLVKPKWKVVA